MPIAQITPDLKMFYELSGKGDPVVLIGGYRADYRIWDLMKKDLESHFQVLAFDNLGAGQTLSQDETPLTVEKMADATFALIHHLKLKSPHIVGQSMGGCIAQTIAKKFADQIKKVAIVNSTNKFNTCTKLTLEGMLKLREENVSMETQFLIGLHWSFSPDYLENPANIASHKEFLAKTPFPQSVENQRKQLHALNEFDSSSWLHEIKNQTLVVVAQSDLVAPPEESAILAKKISNAQLAALPGGHASPRQVSRELTNVLLDFL